MTEPELEEDGYPTEQTLEAIRNWTLLDIPGVFRFIKSAWWHPELWTETHEGNKVLISCSTGGWSGNEDLIGALQKNIAWPLTWMSSRRGGHYEFRVIVRVVRD